MWGSGFFMSRCEMLQNLSVLNITRQLQRLQASRLWRAEKETRRDVCDGPAARLMNVSSSLSQDSLVGQRKTFKDPRQWNGPLTVTDRRFNWEMIHTLMDERKLQDRSCLCQSVEPLRIRVCSSDVLLMPHFFLWFYILTCLNCVHTFTLCFCVQSCN